MKRLLSLMLAACLLCLAGCGSTKDTPSAEEGFYTQASALPPQQALLEVNGSPVSAERYCYFLGRSCDLLAQSWGGEPDWSAQQEGRSLAEYAKETALETAALYAVLAQWAAEYLPGRAAEAPALPSAPELSPALGRSLAEDALHYEQLRRLAMKEGSPLALTTQEADEYARGLLVVSCVRVDTSEALATGDMTALEQRRALAEELLAALVAEPDPMVALATMEDESRGIFVTEKLCFAPGESGLGSAVERTAAFLTPGVWFAAPMEGEGGLYLLLGQSLGREEIVTHAFDQKLRQAVSQAEISQSRAYRSLDVKDFYERLLTLRGGE